MLQRLLIVAVCAGLTAAAPARAQTPASDVPVASPAPPSTSQAAPAGAAAPRSDAAPAGPEAPSPPRSLTVGVLADAAPFSAVGRFGVRTGFDVDIALALCSRLAADCNLLPFNAEDVAVALRDRRIDFAIASLSPMDRVADAVDFTDPYLRIAVRFVRPHAATGPSPLPVAALTGSPEAADVRRLVGNRPVRLYANAEEMWVDLALGRLGSVLAPAISARRDFLATAIGQTFRFAPPSAGEDLGRVAAIGVRRGDGALRVEINRALADLLGTPEYEEMLSRHLDPGLAGSPRPPL